ncbi:hypothetical protein [uncultured Dokdonia sp.]|uniref:hypothetical protein n=1 Tax=uncultured Dokdonia sp. TaxID=575653 RepID=UPI00260C640A|nr:hypothetical protein [uncultured Dokdonia sp.]
MRIVVVLVVLFLGGMTAQANEVTNLDHNNITGIRYNAPQSIHFIQRGVEFIVFPNGEFDFKFLNQQQLQHGRRGHNAPGTVYTNRRNSRYISYDYFGNVTKVGRNFIYYNRNGNVNQIGDITLRYRNGRLVRVGNLRLFYNRRGHIVYTEGFVTHIHNNGTHCDDDDHNYNKKRNRNNVVGRGGKR